MKKEGASCWPLLFAGIFLGKKKKKNFHSSGIAKGNNGVPDKIGPHTVFASWKDAGDDLTGNKA